MTLKLLREGIEETTKEPLFEFETDEYGAQDRFMAFGLKETCLCGEPLFYHHDDHVVFCRYGCCMFEGEWEIEHNFESETVLKLNALRERFKEREE